MPKVFVYENLNTKQVQNKVWGEVREGVTKRLTDFELLLWKGSQVPYAEYAMGESIAGKLYDISDDQLKLTDLYMSEQYERASVLDSKGAFYHYVYIRKQSETPKVVSSGKKEKKAKKGKKQRGNHESRS